MRNMTFGL